MIRFFLLSLVMLIDCVTTFAQSAQKLNSKFGGVQIGVITYSYRSMPQDLESLIQQIKDSGISAVELMGGPVEVYLGRPKDPEGINKWRATISMNEFKKVKKKLKSEGIHIYAYKPDFLLNPHNTDEDIEFAMRSAKALGAESVTTELLIEQPQHSERLARIASKHKMKVGYHNHLQGNDLAWNTVLSQSEFNTVNLDCGHYIAAGGNNTTASLLNYIEKNHQRISSIHMKDRKDKENGGANLKWGEGDTPIKEVLLLLKNKKYRIPVTIELEYKIPKDSDAAKEVKVCMEFAKQILQ
ncbi:sugar phosphate isomerase/epimerase family protein [Sphingobacterium composti Ten et al. 2007 non Yoo et al. 2007]|uniref:sugar phosphate isomerase/epimerase family protein n=1 Tax=Sphingobacterium composti TaxID=363260 RepID=UPI00135B7BF6|nr:sugar phosphate isomerase/epimerase [Sphingobacterium composti Ten et al. 2007 non Yoo et al. 2007]